MSSTELEIILKATDKASPAVKSFEQSLASLGKAALSIYTLKQGFDFLKDSVNKAALEEKNLRTLQTVIENQGESWGNVKGKVTDYIQTMEYNSMFTDEQLIPSMKQLVNSGMNAEQAMKALSSATDLATTTGIDLETSAKLIGKAYNGNTEALARYNIKAKDYNDLMAQISKNFGGAARAEMDTYAGSVKRLETSFEQLQKTIGTTLIPEVNKLVLALDTLLGGGTKIHQTQAEKSLEVINKTITALEQKGQTGTKAYRNLITAQQEWMLIVGSEKKTVNDENKKQSDSKKQTNQEEMDSDYDLMSWEIRLNEQATQAKLDADKRQVESEQLKWTEIAKLAGSTSEAITALGVATNSATLKGMGIVIKGVEGAINAVNQMMLASGPVGFILGLLGFVTSAANTVSSLNQLSELEKQNQSLLQTGNTGITTISNPEVKTSSGGGSSGVSSVERASSPVYYNISNTYNLNAGVILGDEFSIDSAFKKLMERYDMNKQLTTSGA